MADFEDVYSRAGWAEDQFAWLEAEIAVYLSSGVVSVDTEIDSDGNHLYRAHVVMEPPMELAFRTSDVVHHLRATLDNAVWAIHPKGTRNTQFPVASTEKQWANVQHQISGLPEEVVAAIRLLQPFVEGGLGSDLVQLNDLAAWDRHRSPQLLVGITQSAGFGGFDMPHDVPLPEITLGPFQHDEVVGRWVKTGFWIGKDLPLIAFDIDLQFGPETPAHGRTVRVALAAFQGVIERAIADLDAVAT